jgi:tetratricopeptide (TPR) repeat protein
MYAASAFIILELVDIVAPSIGLPDWTMRLTIIILITGFPVAAVLSWIFDLTREGIIKTGSLEETAEVAATERADRRKLRPSDVIIVVLLLIVGVLSYPKIFIKDRFHDIRDEDGRISIAVLPFENLTGDSSLDAYQRGISSLIIDGLVNSPQLAVRDDQSMFEVTENLDQFEKLTISSSMAEKAADVVHAGTYIVGNYQGREDNYRILARMVDAHNGNIICTHQVDGNLNSVEYLDLVDSLCTKIKNYLEIKALEEDLEYDFRLAYSKSPEAYRYYMEGINALMRMEYDLASDLFKSALRIDSTFILAAMKVVDALTLKESDPEPNEWKKYLLFAYENKEKLPYRQQIILEKSYASLISKSRDDLLKYIGLIENSGMDSRYLWFELGEIYSYDLQLYEKAAEAYAHAEKISMERNQDWNHAHFYRRYGQVLHQVGEHEKEWAMYEMGLKLNPNYDRIIRNQATCAFSRGDKLLGEEKIRMLRKVMMENGSKQATIERFVGRAYNDAGLTEMADKHFRRSYESDPNDIWVIHYLGKFLITQDMDVQEGLAIIDKGLELDPDLDVFNLLKGLALYKMGAYEEALLYSKKAVSNLNYYNDDYYKQVDMIEKALNNQVE